jgi:hypothetical protein
MPGTAAARRPLFGLNTIQSATDLVRWQLSTQRRHITSRSALFTALEAFQEQK